MLKHAIAAAILAGTVIPASAQVYKWVDSSGVTHYSQTPPPAGDAKTIGVPQSSGAPSDTAPVKPAADGDAKPSNLTVFANEEERRKALCEQAKQELRTLEAPGQRVTRKTPDGEEVLLSGDERMVAVEAAKEREKKWCPAEPSKE